MFRLAIVILSVFTFGASASRFLNATVKSHGKKKCTPKLNKTAMLQRSALARSLVAAKRPDPTCKTGVVSLAGAVAERPQACCPAYCGECSDYDQCDKVRGQDSANACCLSKVLDLECGGPAKPPANVCLKKCVDAVPPCIMEEGVAFEAPAVTSAAEDCNEAVGEWMTKAESAVKAGKGGAASWDNLEAAGTIYELAQNGTKKQTVKVAPKNGTKKCTPKLNKTSMLQRSTLFKSFVAAKKPDPTCATGVVSLAGAVADRPQACCPAYCGECSDYPECDKVRGQDSANACCLSKVLDLECGGPAKPPANVCLKKCVDAVPPCIMEEGVKFSAPAVTSAAEDCNEAVGEWMTKAESAVKAGKGGAASWDNLETAGTIYELAQNGTKKQTVKSSSLRGNVKPHENQKTPEPKK